MCAARGYLPFSVCILYVSTGAATDDEKREDLWWGVRGVKTTWLIKITRRHGCMYGMCMERATLEHFRHSVHMSRSRTDEVSCRVWLGRGQGGWGTGLLCPAVGVDGTISMDTRGAVG